MTNESIVHSMNELISAVEILALESKRELRFDTSRYPDYAARTKHNELKRALGQLKAARASLLTIYSSDSFEKIKQFFATLHTGENK